MYNPCVSTVTAMLDISIAAIAAKGGCLARMTEITGIMARPRAKAGQTKDEKTDTTLTRKTEL